MKHLSALDIQRIDCQLAAMRRKVLDELVESSPAAFGLSRDSVREVTTHAEDAESERQDDVRFSEIEIDRARLAEIEQAQAQLAAGRYGVCLSCGEEIPRARLLAQPTAIRCAACQMQHESRRHA